MNNGDKPAAPIQYLSGDDDLGLTKREAFAMAAMQGYIAAGGDLMPDKYTIAELSVDAADQLLKALKETK